DLNSEISSTPCGDQSRVSAEVPSTAPPTPSDVATSMRPGSLELGSAVTSTPDLSFGTDSRMTTEESTHNGSSMSVCRQENERDSNGEAQTCLRPSSMSLSDLRLNTVRFSPAPLKLSRSSTLVSLRTKQPTV